MAFRAARWTLINIRGTARSPFPTRISARAPSFHCLLLQSFEERLPRRAAQRVLGRARQPRDGGPENGVAMDDPEGRHAASLAGGSRIDVRQPRRTRIHPMQGAIPVPNPTDRKRNRRRAPNHAESRAPGAGAAPGTGRPEPGDSAASRQICEKLCPSDRQVDPTPGVCELGERRLEGGL